MPRSLVSTLPLALLMVAAGCDDASAPADPTPGHDVVFEGYPAGIPELMVRDAATGEVRRLLPAGTPAVDPAPSPDGTRIAFAVVDANASTGDVFVVDRDGGNLTQLTFDPALDEQPAWSPDGTRLAFRSERALKFGDIWVMDADGNNPVNLTPDPPGIAVDEHHPCWSPDGTRIAFISTAAGENDPWTMAADGSDWQPLAVSPWFDTEPAWSPDGTTIAFRRSSDDDPGDIVLVPAGGGAETVLALPGRQEAPAWRPDGRGLVFAHRPVGQQRYDIWVMDADGAHPTPLVTAEVAGGSRKPAFLKRP